MLTSTIETAKPLLFLTPILSFIVSSFLCVPLIEVRGQLRAFLFHCLGLRMGLGLAPLPAEPSQLAPAKLVFMLIHKPFGKSLMILVFILAWIVKENVSPQV